MKLKGMMWTGRGYVQPDPILLSQLVSLAWQPGIENSQWQHERLKPLFVRSHVLPRTRTEDDIRHLQFVRRIRRLEQHVVDNDEVRLDLN